MKFPNHILLDVQNNNLINSKQYWIFKYFFLLNSNSIFFNSLTFNSKFLTTKFNRNFFFFNNQQQFTLKYIPNNLFFLLNLTKPTSFNTFNSDLPLNYENIFNNTFNKNKNFFKKTNFFWTLFDINFLRKEKIYTKLKYSRVPQYDIVSGGVAALFSGFLGFLICEKFGFELIDSGDFYILFMYLVFLIFALRPFLKITSKEKLSWNAFSYKWILLYYRNVIILIFNKIKF